MSTIYNIGPSWKGFSFINRLVIFGDSFSSVDYVLDYDETKPNAADPLGLPFPGSNEYGLWNEPDLPNWVGHLITKFRPGPLYTPPKPHTAGKLRDQSDEWKANPLLVYNYAKGGDTLDGVSRQVQNLFLPGLGKKPAGTPWTAEETLFITWVGINDCASQVRDDAMERLFDLQDRVYSTGARNFLFINVPPIHRSPAIRIRTGEAAPQMLTTWNANLRKAAQKFCSTHLNSSVFLLSSFHFFNTLLDNPTAYGFSEAEIKKRSGSFWFDHIHPTSKVHEYIASYLASFLFNIPASGWTAELS
ncbi:hypothetical protein BDN70DRAFT_872259 [Pholiota conissans]|uniref:Carbohydrate esterase family 16 protein n=1 Tax=Pholiota conissans TaxID=109636 RepID=A0A9P5ZC61_9AGAR|nr:hypothetical protein BDN70DRAFT_872259 [Pholiota conissans]